MSASVADVESLVLALRRAGAQEIVVVLIDGVVRLSGQAEYVHRALVAVGEPSLASEVERLRSVEHAIVIEVRERRATVRREPVIELSAPGGLS
jgi:hypothetical protein